MRQGNGWSAGREWAKSVGSEGKTFGRSSGIPQNHRGDGGLDEGANSNPVPSAFSKWGIYLSILFYLYVFHELQEVRMVTESWFTQCNQLLLPRIELLEIY